jgi:hypothetical protein
MGKSLRWFNATAKTDPTFPEAKRFGNRYFYHYDEYINWLRNNIA